MGYGYLALAVKSEHDKYLVGNPEFTYFKAVYKRHTNFAIDYTEVLFAHSTENCLGKKIYMNVPKGADLLHRSYLCVDINISGSERLEFGNLNGWHASGFAQTAADKGNYAPLAYNLIEFIDLYIGDQLIDRHYGEWLHIWHELFENSEKNLALANMIQVNNEAGGKRTLTIPLRFWFNNNVGLALPLVSMQYANVKLEIKFNKKSEVERLSDKQTVASPISVSNVRLLLENIYLDQEERRLFTSNKHEYLITQVQSSIHNIINDVAGKWDSSNFTKLRHEVDLRFRYPVKELFWSIQDREGKAIPRYHTDLSGDFKNTGCFKYNYWNNFRIGQDQMSYCTLVLNNKNLMDELPAPFYRNTQQYQYHNSYGIEHVDLIKQKEGNPALNYQDYSRGSGIYSYSFAIYPGQHQPSGSLNFSKLQNAKLKFGLNKGKTWDFAGSVISEDAQNKNKVVNIYALNYNILRITGGLGALAFTN